MSMIEVAEVFISMLMVRSRAASIYGNKLFISHLLLVQTTISAHLMHGIGNGIGAWTWNYDIWKFI